MVPTSVAYEAVRVADGDVFIGRFRLESQALTGAYLLRGRGRVVSPDAVPPSGLLALGAGPGALPSDGPEMLVCIPFAQVVELVLERSVA